MLNIRFAVLTLSLAVLLGCSPIVFGQDDDNLSKVKGDQKSLADRYRQLENKLYSLYEFEKNNNPGRAKLLQQAFEQSQERMTTGQLALIVELMNKSKFKDAEKEQEVALAQLTELLTLLQSEDQSQLIRSEIKRYQQYAKEVDRILRIQKGIRGQTEGGVDPERLAKSEEKAANRTDELSKEIERNESPSNKDQSGEAKGDRSDGQKSETGDPKETNGEEGKQGEGEQGEGEQGEGEQGEGKQGEGEQGEGEQGEGGKGEGGEGQQGPQQESPASQIQQKIDAAKQKMNEAQKALDDAKRDNAVQAMREAEKALEQAKRELEEILRQLREEEIEQTLAMLEDRFREMLEKQVRIFESTQKMNETPDEARGTEFEIGAGKLGEQQTSLATDAGRALLLLREDGSSVAFPATVEEVRQDMLQSADRLNRAKVNPITLQIQEDIIESLGYIVEALKKTQEDMEKMKSSPPPPSGQQQPGDQPLVDQLAELKMLKSMQQRIHRRHRRYSKFLDDPNDPVGFTENEDVTSALKRLTDRQALLTEITRELVNEANK